MAGEQELHLPAACVDSVLLCGASVAAGGAAAAAGGGTAGKGPQKGKMPGGKPGNMPGATGEESKQRRSSLSPLNYSKRGFGRGNNSDALHCRCARCQLKQMLPSGSTFLDSFLVRLCSLPHDVHYRWKQTTGLVCLPLLVAHHWQVGPQGHWRGPPEQGAGPGAGLESDCCSMPAGRPCDR